MSVLLYSDEIKIKNIHTTIVKFKNLPEGFPQHFLLSDVYFLSLLDSVVFK